MAGSHFSESGLCKNRRPYVPQLNDETGETCVRIELNQQMIRVVRGCLRRFGGEQKDRKRRQPVLTGVVATCNVRECSGRMFFSSGRQYRPRDPSPGTHSRYCACTTRD